jgi:hypothetical protein
MLHKSAFLIVFVDDATTPRAAMPGLGVRARIAGAGRVHGMASGMLRRDGCLGLGPRGRESTI